MAGNRKYALGRQLLLAPTNPAAPTDGTQCLVGQIPGVALGNPDAGGNVSVDMAGVYNLTVYGTGDGGAGVAVAIGDILYYELDTDHITKDNVDGVRFGYALGTVGSGANAVIAVKVGY